MTVLPFKRGGGTIFLDRGTIKGSLPPARVFWLEYKDSDGAMIVWQSGSRSDAMAAARTWTRSGVRLIDKSGGAR